MTRQKKWVYAIGILVSVLMLALYTHLVLQTTQRSAEERLAGALHSATNSLHRDIAGYTQDILFQLDAYADTPMNAQSIPEVLGALERAYPERDFHMAMRDGSIMDAAGNPVGPLTNLQPLQDARRMGYSVINYADTQGVVAFIVPMPGHRAHYLLQIEPVDKFLLRLRESFPLDASYAAVFNEFGKPVSSYFWGNAADSYELSQSVQHGASDYIARRSSQIQPLPLRRGYNLYIPLTQPEGWFIGARVPLSSAAATDTGMMQVHLLVLPLWLIGAAFLILMDILNDRRHRDSLRSLATTDSLTGLTNNSGMENAMIEFARKNTLDGYSFVVLDIVSFHRINALYGHTVGDSLLHLVAGVLRKHYICPARVYGDVFAFLAKSSATLTATVEGQLYDAINFGIGKPYRKMIRFKFGVYPILGEHHSFRQIIDGAHLALRDAKKTPKQSEVVYDYHLQKLVDLKRNIEANMLHALSQQEFLVYIQPKFHVRSGECCGGEALVRWQSQELGFLMPDSFVPLFEDNGFIVEIDLYMLRRSLQILQRQLESGGATLPISVNMSRVTITFPNFIERLENLVKETTVPLQYLEIEITESALEHDRSLVVPLMHSLKEMGFVVALDDFGSGFSSLNSLRDLPVDILKIDRAFLQESEVSEKSRKIVRSILNMARELEIGVVCEGVESAQQQEFLRESGDIIAQGFYYSKPIPLDEYERTYLAEMTLSLS